MCLLFLRLVSLDLLLFTSEFYGYLCPPNKGEGGGGGGGGGGGEHIGFSVDPVSIGDGVTNSCTHDIS